MTIPNSHTNSGPNPSRDVLLIHQALSQDVEKKGVNAGGGYTPSGYGRRIEVNHWVCVNEGITHAVDHPTREMHQNAQYQRMAKR